MLSREVEDERARARARPPRRAPSSRSRRSTRSRRRAGRRPGDDDARGVCQSGMPVGTAPGAGRRVARQSAAEGPAQPLDQRRPATGARRRASPGRTPKTSTPTSATSAKTTALVRRRAKRRSSSTRKKPAIATITIAPRVAWGRSSKSGAGSPVSRMRPAATIESAASSRRRAPRRSSGSRRRTGRSRPRGRRARSSPRGRRVAVQVDAVALAVAIVRETPTPRRSRSSCRAPRGGGRRRRPSAMSGTRGRERAREGRRRRRRRGPRGRAAPTRAIASASTISVAGKPRRESGGTRRSARRSAAPTASVQPCSASSSPTRSQSCSKNLPLVPSTPKSFDSWPIATVSPSPNRNPVITGFETRSITPPSRSAPATDEDDGDDDREPGRQRREPRGVAVRKRPDRSRRERRRRRGRADDERPRRAEQRVGEQRAGRGGEAGRGRQAGDLRVGDRLRRDDAPDDQPRDEVGREPVAVGIASSQRGSSSSLERAHREGRGEPERREDADELAAVLERLGHHRVGEHRQDRAAREGQHEGDDARARRRRRGVAGERGERARRASRRPRAPGSAAAPQPASASPEWRRRPPAGSRGRPRRASPR